MSEAFTKPFRLGDTVKNISKTNGWKFGVVHIIHGIELNQGCIEYSTDHGAWFEHKDFELVKVCDEESLAKLVKSIRDEENSEE